MSNFSTPRIHAVVSTFLAAAIVAWAALTVDQGQATPLPRGVIEIGELVPVEATSAIENA